jgi:hypothetical protein
MSSLIVLCPHCLTWIECHGECCTECARAIYIEEHDPDDQVLALRLGDRLADLGPVKLLRRGWPDCGHLLATTQGLLFVPEFRIQRNGALEATADDAPTGSGRVANLLHWWSLPPWRRPVEVDEADSPAAAEIPARPATELLLNSPGAFFVGRDSIQRIQIRWGRAQIERQPFRTVTLDQAQGGVHPRDLLRPLMEFAPWQAVASTLSSHAR